MPDKEQMGAPGQEAVPRSSAVAWAWGSLFALLGAWLVVWTGLADGASVRLLALFLLLSGALEMAYGIAARRRRGLTFLPALLSGVLAVAVGVLLLAVTRAREPAQLATVAGYFLIRATYRGGVALAARTPGWRWDLFYSVPVAVMGLLVLALLPDIGPSAVALLLGGEIVLRGLQMGPRAASLDRIQARA